MAQGGSNDAIDQPIFVSNKLQHRIKDKSKDRVKFWRESAQRSERDGKLSKPPETNRG